ncbi:hypothetical protein BXZ70DRAFT_1003557 [Cristinia sonorae]|uniref:Arrestin-like N-terminal domain-containing protein n=1 Tax=Cristinia sonorae TaxID=1940300 RepID=A0A8K0XX17_9AGAR|nr:hypothetical protein BXZ70DRAFT_1003557 [Cristinia sonorae]
MSVQLDDRLSPFHSFHNRHGHQSDSLPVPRYTEQAQVSERVLHRSSTLPSTLANGRGVRDREYKYRTDNVEVDLGPCPWGLLYAAYGRGGTVRGTVTFLKKCSSVLQVTVTLQASLSITTSMHTMVSGFASKPLITRKVTVFMADSSSSPSPVQGGTSFPFNLPFPETIDDLDVSLPPSCSVFYPITAEINYTVRIDVVRGKFYRHEMRTIPILYLPKSSPQLPPMVGMPWALSGDELPPGLKRVDVAGVWPDECHAHSADRELATVELFLPDSPVFAAGDLIPLGLRIRCHSSPAIPKLLSGNIGVFLVKRKKVWVSEGRQISVKELAVGRVSDLHVNSMVEGAMYLTMELQAGEVGTELSWSVPGFIDVEYIIRVIVRPPAYAKHLPVFKRDEVIQLCTDPYGSLTRELLTMDGTPTPALGLYSTPAAMSALRSS